MKVFLLLIALAAINSALWSFEAAISQPTILQGNSAKIQVIDPFHINRERSTAPVYWNHQAMAIDEQLGIYRAVYTAGQLLHVIFLLIQ